MPTHNLSNTMNKASNLKNNSMINNKIINPIISRNNSPNNNLNNHNQIFINKSRSSTISSLAPPILFLSLTIFSLIFLSSSVQANPSYIPDPFTGEIIAIMTDDGKLYFPVWDLTEYKLYDEGGNLVYSQKYTPFGEILSLFGTNPFYWTPQGFQDPDTDINMDIAVSSLDAVLAESADPPYDTSTAKFLQDWGTIAIKDAPKNIALCMRGAKNAIIESLIGTCYAIAHPFQTAEAIGGMAGSLYYQPEETLSGYGNAIATYVSENWDNPEAIGGAAVGVADAIAGSKFAGKALNLDGFTRTAGRYGLPNGLEWGGIGGIEPKTKMRQLLREPHRTLYHHTDKAGLEGIINNKLIWGSNTPLAGVGKLRRGFVYLTDLRGINANNLRQLFLEPVPFARDILLRSPNDFTHKIKLIVPKGITENFDKTWTYYIFAHSPESPLKIQLSFAPHIYRIPCAIGNRVNPLGVHLIEVEKGVYFVCRSNIDKFRAPRPSPVIKGTLDYKRLIYRDIYPK